VLFADIKKNKKLNVSDKRQMTNDKSLEISHWSLVVSYWSLVLKIQPSFFGMGLIIGVFIL